MAEANGVIDFDAAENQLMEACEDVVNILAQVLNDLTGQAIAALTSGEGVDLFRHPEVSAEILRDGVFELHLVALNAVAAE